MDSGGIKERPKFHVSCLRLLFLLSVSFRTKFLAFILGKLTHVRSKGEEVIAMRNRLERVVEICADNFFYRAAA